MSTQAQPEIQPRDLRLLRIAQGRSLAEVARQGGVSVSALSLIERGRRPLTPHLLIRLLRVFFSEPTS